MPTNEADKLQKFQDVLAGLNSLADVLETMAATEEVLDKDSWECAAARATVDAIGRMSYGATALYLGEDETWEEQIARHCESISGNCAKAVSCLERGLIAESEDNESWAMWINSIPTDIADAISLVPEEFK